MENGWIKLHRRLLENPISKKPHYVWLWITLLLKANHKDIKHMWNGEIIIIKEGQIITGRKELSIITGIPESTIEDILKFLERQHQIRQQKTTKYRLIDIVNWTTYQKPDIKSNNKATTKQQQADTNNNVKNDKNEKNLVPKGTSELSSQVQKIMEVFYKINPTLNWGNTTSRKSAEFMIKKFGFDGTLKMAEQIISVQGQRYAPVATTPTQMKDKLAQFKIYFDSLNNKSKIIEV